MRRAGLGTAWALGVAAPLLAAGALGGVASATGSAPKVPVCVYAPGPGAHVTPLGTWQLAYVYARPGTQVAVYGPGGITAYRMGQRGWVAWHWSQGAYAITAHGFVRCGAGR
jgi:hypothetical protein